MHALLLGRAAPHRRILLHSCVRQRASQACCHNTLATGGVSAGTDVCYVYGIQPLCSVITDGLYNACDRLGQMPD